MKRLVLLPLTVLLCASTALLAACGSSGGGSTDASATGPAAATTPSATSATTTSTTTATEPTSTTSTTTTTPTAAAASASPCRAANLHLSFLGQQGGMGHGEIGFALQNAGAASCRTFGYPGVLFLDKQGRGLPTIPHHTTRDFFGSGPAKHLVIAPGASASFHLDVGHGVATSAGCATAYGLQVIPPDDTATLRTTIPNGAYECRDANVSPMRAGVTGYP